MENKEYVHHPSHYNQGTIEAIKVIDDWELSFNLGSTIKYIARYRYKGKPLEDLKKALWYLEHEIELMENKHE